jgi:hypothetical protein
MITSSETDERGGVAHLASDRRVGHGRQPARSTVALDRPQHASVVVMTMHSSVATRPRMRHAAPGNRRDSTRL